MAIREYLIGVTAAALICGVAVKLMPGGSVGVVVKMAGGILMLLAVVGPLLKLEWSELEDFTEEMEASAEKYAAEGEEQAHTALCEGISRQVEAYILDKADDLEAELTVEVELTDEQLPVPRKVILQGRISPYAKSVLSDYLEDTLGIGPEAQIWTS